MGATELNSNQVMSLDITKVDQYSINCGTLGLMVTYPITVMKFTHLTVLALVMLLHPTTYNH